MRVNKRPKQRTVHLDDDTLHELEDFEKQYPLLPFSMVMNAALRVYFHGWRVSGGIDGNLQPLRHAS